MKSKIYRSLALFLAVLMVTALLPTVVSAENDAAEASRSAFPIVGSILPIRRVSAELDLTSYTPEQLAAISVSDVLANLTDTSYEKNPIELDPSATTVWSNIMDENGNWVNEEYEIHGMSDVINLQSEMIMNSYYESQYKLELIVGSGSQLDRGNVRYMINNVKFPSLANMPKTEVMLDWYSKFKPEIYTWSVADVMDQIVENAGSEKVDADYTDVMIFGGGYYGTRVFQKDVPFSPYDWDIEYTNKKIINIVTMTDGKITENSVCYTVMIRMQDPAFNYSMFNWAIYEQHSDETGETVRNPMADYDDYSRSHGYSTISIYSAENPIKYVKPATYFSLKSRYADIPHDYYVGLSFQAPYEYPDMQVKFMSGILRGSVEEAAAYLESHPELDITEQLTCTDMSELDAGYQLRYYDDFTAIFYVDDLPAFVQYESIDISYRSNSIGIYTKLYHDAEDIRARADYDYTTYYTSVYSDQGRYLYQNRELRFKVRPGYAADDTFYYYCSAINGDTGMYDNSVVEKAVIGSFLTLEDAADETDIKEQLFSDDYTQLGSGYAADYSGDGVTFTVFLQGGVTEHFTIIAENYENIPYDPSSDSNILFEDIYSSEGESLDAYRVRNDMDSYRKSNYTTFLLLDDAADVSALIPYASVHSKAKLYSGGVELTLPDTGNTYKTGLLQPADFSGTASEEFADIQPDHSVKYVASAEDGKGQTNVYLTVVQVQDEPTLFVNGPKTREVFLDTYSGKYHDIFVANIGKAELTGLSAELNATNVKLHDYWTIGGSGNDTLGAFTETFNADGPNGELFNIAKIRLLPDGDGIIEGTLTISADGVEPQVIKLTGTAGDPRIDTDSLHDAVKYVPYSSIITTTNMYDWNTVSFEIIDGALPEGIELKENGELYGTPTEFGEFTFTIRANNSYEEFSPTEAELTLVVLDNTDENVDNSVDEGYEVQVRIEDELDGSEDVEFKVAGEFSEFVDFWLDGEKLVRDTDYSAEEGSTRITIRSRTIQKQNDGTHTISAEFRNAKSELKTSSQNLKIKIPTITTYYVDFQTNGGNAIQGYYVDEGECIAYLPTPTKENYDFAGWYENAALTIPFSTYTYAYGDITLYAKWRSNQEPLPAGSPETIDGFTDIDSKAWYYKDMKWAYEEHYIVGTSSRTLSPNGAVTYSTIAAILARIGRVDLSMYANMNVRSVDNNQWYSSYMKWAVSSGLFDNMAVSANGEISRENIAIVIHRFLKAMGTRCPTAAVSKAFADEAMIAPEAKTILHILYDIGIFRGIGENRIAPKNITTRCEFSALAHRLSTYMK